MFKKKKEQTCCVKMKGLYDVDSQLGINFRVIKISESFIEKGIKRGIPTPSNKYRYVFSDGYSNKLSSDESKLLFIEYCPFCGKKLSSVYKDDLQVNESNHDW